MGMAGAAAKCAARSSVPSPPSVMIRSVPPMQATAWDWRSISQLLAVTPRWLSMSQIDAHRSAALGTAGLYRMDTAFSWPGTALPSARPQRPDRADPATAGTRGCPPGPGWARLPTPALASQGPARGPAPRAAPAGAPPDPEPRPWGPLWGRPRTAA